MSFKFLNAIDLYDYVEDVIASQVIPGPSTSFAIFVQTGSGGPSEGYIPLRELAQCLINPDSENVVTMAFDPITLDGSSPQTIIGDTSNKRNPWFSDTSNPADPTKTFSASTSGATTGSAFREWNVLNQTVGGLPSGWHASFLLQIHSGFTVNQPGHYSAAGDGAFWAFFLGLTDGIPGETDTGDNIYPEGLALAHMTGCTMVTGGDLDDAFVWVDIATGWPVGYLQNTPGATSTVTSQFTEAPIAAQVFDWHVFQFQPDADSTAGTPKGELFLQSEGNFQIPGSSDPRAVFIKVMDFNPFGIEAASGQPTRTHERVRVVSALEFDDDPLFGIAGGSNALDSWYPGWHAPSRRFFMVLAANAAGGTNATGEHAIGYWARSVEPVEVTAPVARDVPRTNDIVDFESYVIDNLALGVAGVDVDWALYRNSTEDEVLDASTFPGSSVVDHYPIDDTEPSQNEGTLVVTADGSILAETTDYTVVLSTGVITWVTDQSGKTLVTATYEHRNTDATPAHGTLLTSTSKSEDNGRVTAQVSWADNNDLVGEMDRLIGTIA